MTNSSHTPLEKANRSLRGPTWLLVTVLFLFPFLPAGRANAQSGEQELSLVAYPDHLSGRRTASGQIYNPNGLTVAHPSLPLGTMLELESLPSGRRVMVTVNDRGGIIGGGDLLASRMVMERLGIQPDEVAHVRAKRWQSASSGSPVRDLADRLAMTASPRNEAGGRRGDQSATPEASSNPSRAGTESTPSTAGSPEVTATEPTTSPGDRVQEAPPVPTRATSTAQGSAFAVQLGAYADAETAKSVAATMAGTWVQSASVDGRSVHRVFFGRYNQRAEAEGWQARLDALGIPGYVRTLE